MYDFLQLSPYDFECLVLDVLSAEWQLRLEMFCPGPDQGIDIRHLSPAGVLTHLVQCQHYPTGGYKALLKQLKAKEFGRAQAYVGIDYYLATTVPLTPPNKESVMNALSHVISSQDRVLGREDLNDLSRRHPSVERQHIKLWLPSGQMLWEMLNSRITGRGRMLAKRAERRVARYVPTDSHAVARVMLDKHHICLISGPPGIGKTTLAEMVALDYARDKFQLLIVSEDIAEAETAFNPREPQLFFYDDFLGNVVGQLLAENEETRLLDFMLTVKENPNTRLLMTTREYILRDAVERYERLTASDILTRDGFGRG